MYNYVQILTGTHWVWEIITMLLKQKAEYHPLTREHVFLDVIDDLSSLDTLSSPRVFNTHMPYRWLPREHFKAGRKVVNVIRNPKDVAVSWYCHWHSSNELGCGSISWSEFFEEVVMGQCTSTNAFGCLYFNIICKIAVSKISCCAITYSGIYMFCCVFFQIKMHLEDISTFRENYTMLSSLMKGTHFVPCITKI